MTPRQSLEQAKQAADTQRRKLRDTANAARARLLPARLVGDAKGKARDTIDELKNDTLAHVRAHPILAALGITAIIAWAARKPLLKRAPSAVGRIYAALSGNLAFSQILSQGDDKYCDEGDQASPPQDDDEELSHG
ncbi:MAG: hypothetical protein AABZ45_08625 [Pseudomonadota bacterium]